MASRIRRLEDELNHSDYELMVLRQQLERAEQRNDRLNTRDESSSTPRRPSLRDRLPNLEPLQGDESDRLERERESVSPELPSSSPYDLDIDLGSPVEDPLSPPEMSIGEPVDPDSGGANPDSLPPVQPLPPRSEEIQLPPIEPGTPTPPNLQDGREELPPGQIKTPDTARLLLPPQPTTLKLHAGLSGTHHADDDNDVDGMYLVLTLHDQNGQPMPANQPVSIVLLDPARDTDDARLGRWDFTAEQVKQAFHDSPIPSIQLPVLWQDKKPAGDQVAVFARLAVSDEQFATTDLMLEMKSPTPSNWQSRGLGTPEKPPRSTRFNSEEVWR